MAISKGFTAAFGAAKNSPWSTGLKAYEAGKLGIKAYKAYKSTPAKVVKTKKVSREQQVVPTTEGISRSYHYLNKSRKIKKKKGVKGQIQKALMLDHPPTIYEQISPWSVINSLNQTQVVGTIGSSFIFDIQTVRSLMKGALASEGFGTNGSLANTGVKDFKFLCNDAKVITTFQNQSLTACEFDIYDLVYKKDCSLITGYYPQDLWTNGINAISVNGVNGITQPYCVPTTSREFNDKIQICKVTKVELGPGRGHEHVWNYISNKLIDTMDTELDPIKGGLTGIQMVVARGQLGDTIEGNTSVGNVGLTGVKIIGLQRIKFTGRLVSSVSRQYQTNSTLTPIALTVPVFSENEFGIGPIVNDTAGSFA